MNWKNIRTILDALNPLAYRLLRWIITSNRCHLVKLPYDKHIMEMNTIHQYIMLTCTPEKEATFTTYKAKFGSFFAFHGSSMENWHAILRGGLKNMSNKTGYMINGCVHGPGIYLAPLSSTSLSYVRSTITWDKSSFGESMSCIALCEVIDHPSVKGRNHQEWCYVVENEDFVITRFFFIYGNNFPIPSSVTARNLKIPEIDQFGVNHSLASPKVKLGKLQAWWNRLISSK